MSRLIWFFVVAALIIVGFGVYAIGSQRNNPTVNVTVPAPTPFLSASPSAQVISGSPTMTTKQVIEGFYASYEDCLKNPPQQAAGQVGRYCQSNNPFISESFVTNLERGGVSQAGADPVVCAQSLPQDIQVGTFPITDNRAEGQVTETFAGGIVQPTISLVKQPTGWKIDNIICPSL